MPRAPSAHSVDAQLARRVQRAAHGTVFTPATFAALGSRAAIDKALQRLVAKGHLRRMSRGFYDKPRHHEVLGTLWPGIDAIVRAIAGKDRVRTQPTGAYAANLLGLSEQVPAKVVLLTDGTGRSVQVGPTQITLKRTTPRDMAAAGRLSGLVIQAFKSLGAPHITADRIRRLRQTIPAQERAKLLRDVALAPAWMQPHLRKLALPDETDSSAESAAATAGEKVMPMALTRDFKQTVRERAQRDPAFAKALLREAGTLASSGEPPGRANS